MKITDLDVASLEPADKPRQIAAGDGLYLVVHPTGSKHWRFDYRFQGQRKKLNMGSYLATSRDEARRRCDRARSALAKEKRIPPQAAGLAAVQGRRLMIRAESLA